MDLVKIDLLSKDTLVFPIHMNGNHWIYIIVDVSEAKLEIYYSLGSKEYPIVVEVRLFQVRLSIMLVLQRPVSRR